MNFIGFFEKLKIPRPKTLTEISVVAVCENSIPFNRELTFAKTDEMKNAIAVIDGETVVGFATAETAVLIKSLIENGTDVRCKLTKIREGTLLLKKAELYYYPQKV